MGNPLFQSPTDPVTPCLALRPREAAKALGISERTLWTWTDTGLIPCVRIGKAVLYPVDTLRRWLSEQAKQAAAAPANASATPADGGGQ